MSKLAKAAMMGAAGAAGGPGAYIEDVFSTYLYTGNGSTQTITNGIDLSGEGGLVWIKGRTANTYGTNHVLFDSERGPTFRLISNLTGAQNNNGATSFASTGFSLPSSSDLTYSTEDYASWTFRKAEKFFDVVTYTGNGASNNVNHSLNAAPGFVLIKRTDSTSDWFAYARYADSGNPTFPYSYKDLRLNTTAASVQNIGSISTSTFFRADSTGGNVDGATYVAYLFAHDAGGFGDDGNDSVVSCGSFTTDGSYNSSTTLGWEPQWVLVKSSSATGYWFLFDNMRGMPVSGDNSWLVANTSQVESQSSVACRPNATGFTTFNLSANTTHIYIAIRRGPMKTPTDATEVFKAVKTTSQPMSIGFPTDLHIDTQTSATGSKYWVPRLTNGYMSTTSTGSENAGSLYFKFDLQNSFSTDTFWGSSETINWHFRRAPGFFDVVAYTGTGVARTVNHNLAVAPELMIVKKRTGSVVTGWAVYAATRGPIWYGQLNNSGVFNIDTTTFNNTYPTSSVFSVGTSTITNASDSTYIAYLFATCSGVSKVGSYTGTGTTLDVNCGFAAGARFVLIKRTDNTAGDWYVWDTARGIVSGNDPYLLLNSSAAEVTNTDYIDPLSSGFQISSTAPDAINADGGSYIFLAIA